MALNLTLLGLIIYFAFQNSLGESRKPWLGLNQEKGVVGIGTAKKKVKVRVDIEAGSGASKAPVLGEAAT